MKKINYFVMGICTVFINIASAHDLSSAPESNVRASKPEILQTIDLSKEIPGVEGRQLRMRKVVLEPGGVIAPHSHVDRPAVVYVLSGRVREHRSDRDAPLEYGAGDSMIESAALHHWVESIGEQPLVGVVVDIANESGARAFSEEEILKAYGLEKHVH